MIKVNNLFEKGGSRVLPIVQAMQLLSEAGYEPLGPLVAQREFPLLVKKQQVVSVAKLVDPENIPVLQRLKQQPIPRMPRIEALLTAADCIVSVETLINGQTLADRLRAHGPFSPEMTVRVAQELLVTLQALGQQQIVHRDLKLSNVMDYRDHYYLIDVNAARQYHAEQESDTRLLGTSGFAAPENYGFAQTDQRSDLYSLGIVLNCLLTGQEPRGPLDTTTLTQDSTWAPIIMKATALDPQQRYQSATAMLAALPGHDHYRPHHQSVIKRIQVQQWWPQAKRILQIGLWGLYGLFVIVAVSTGFDQTTWHARVDFWVTGFMLIGAPLIAHYANRWLQRHWPVSRWHRYQWWLRVAEAIFIFWVLGRDG
ncbi:protein kinase domain-containing protein [Lactiplantibacillus paraplantarum]|uniref:protein kinase domain-containing protein n=1 Tax=Lactiplantibacillus paraplantarum TaxID=60520 RepID=UPI0030844DBD